MENRNPDAFIEISEEWEDELMKELSEEELLEEQSDRWGNEIIMERGF